MRLVELKAGGPALRTWINLDLVVQVTFRPNATPKPVLSLSMLNAPAEEITDPADIGAVADGLGIFPHVG